jgi:hypothetical protein
LATLLPLLVLWGEEAIGAAAATVSTGFDSAAVAVPEGDVPVVATALLPATAGSADTLVTGISSGGGMSRFPAGEPAADGLAEGGSMGVEFKSCVARKPPTSRPLTMPTGINQPPRLRGS